MPPPKNPLSFFDPNNPIHAPLALNSNAQQKKPTHATEQASNTGNTNTSHYKVDPDDPISARAMENVRGFKAHKQ